VDPDFFPPTINAILNLAEQMDQVVVISRNNSVEDYPYPLNVRLKKIGKRISVRDMEKQPLWKKLWCFLGFSFSLLREARKSTTSLLLLYDPFALFAFFLSKPLNVGKKIWYHNHDLVDVKSMRKYSLGYWAAKMEWRAMKHINFFSLPSRERLAFYPRLKAGIPVFVIPNYPSLKVYKATPQKSLPKNGKVRVIYQGFIGPGHGLEIIAKLFADKIGGYQWYLVLKGSVTADFKNSIDEIAKENNVSGQVQWEGVGPYYDLPGLTQSCDIGIGINTNSDTVSLTQGTSSNKIYEYAASGLPVLVNRNEQFTQYLGNYDWVYFTDGTESSIKEVLEMIIKTSGGVGLSARDDFEKTLNFEECFLPALNKIINSTNSSF